MKIIINLLIKIVPWFVIAYLWCNIYPTEAYAWYDGLWHGLYMIPNWIISWFQDGRLCKAAEYTTGYNFCWWFSTVINFICGLFAALAILLVPFALKAQSKR